MALFLVSLGAMLIASTLSDLITWMGLLGAALVGAAIMYLVVTFGEGEPWLPIEFDFENLPSLPLWPWRRPRQPRRKR
jgi:hypothetical protein